MNWVPDIAPLPSRDHGRKDLPPPSRDHGKKNPPPPSRDHGKENLPPPEEPRKLPRKIRPHRRREKHHIPSSSQTGSQPGISRSPGSAMHAPVKHPLTSQRPQHPQPLIPAANHNSSHDYLQDHPESRRVYKPARSSIQQDSTTRSRRESFSGSGLSSPALQRSHRGSFSGLPSGQLNKKLSLTDPLREARIAGGWRPGPVQSHPCAAHPDVCLALPCQKLPQLAVLNDRLWYWKYQNPNGWSPPAVQNRPADKDPGRPGAITTNDPGTALQRYAGPGSALPPQDAGVINNTPPCVNKKSHDTGVNRRSCDNPLFPCIVGKGRPAIPLKIGPQERNPRHSHPTCALWYPCPMENRKG